MKVLVTGGSGMLGRAVSYAAKIADHRVLTPSHRELDLEDEAATLKYLEENNPEAILHCAAKVGGISANIANPSDFLSRNIKIDSALLGAAKNLNTPNLIYMGSSCMYPRNFSHPMKESEILSGQLEPTNESYALAKLVGWKTVQINSSSLNWRTFVLSNLYGPNDHFEPERSHLLAAIIAKIHLALRNNDEKIVMWGDGSARRQFTFVDDVADFIVKSLGNLVNFPATLNLGAEGDYSISDFYQIASKVMGYEGQIVADLTKPTGMARKLMDVRTASSFGWVANTTIEAGIKKTADWYQAQSKGESK
jgi:GDP-L-fucose synthase